MSLSSVELGVKLDVELWLGKVAVCTCLRKPSDGMLCPDFSDRANHHFHQIALYSADLPLSTQGVLFTATLNGPCVYNFRIPIPT